MICHFYKPFDCPSLVIIWLRLAVVVHSKALFGWADPGLEDGLSGWKILTRKKMVSVIKYCLVWSAPVKIPALRPKKKTPARTLGKEIAVESEVLT
jgi:hypothetical protein